MNQSIWNSLKNTKNGYLIKSEMNQTQLEECSRLENFLKNYLLENYNSKTINKIISKTSVGYNVRRVCYKKFSSCLACWQLKINILNNECVLICKNRCSHFSVKQPTGN